LVGFVVYVYVCLFPSLSAILFPFHPFHIVLFSLIAVVLDDVIRWAVSWVGFVLWSAPIGSHYVWNVHVLFMVILIHNGSLWEGHGINSAKLTCPSDTSGQVGALGQVYRILCVCALLMI